MERSGRDLPPLRYLAAADVEACLPALPERLRLAERTLLGLAGGVQLPPKIGVHPRPPGSFAHAMPAWLAGPSADGAADVLGMKWIAGVPSNAAAGLPALHALVLVNDPRTGVPVAILDGAPITAARTAAISGTAIARWSPAIAGRPARAAVLGAGVQGRAHVDVLGHLLPGVEVAIVGRDAARAAALAAEAAGRPGIGAAAAVADPWAAVAGADVVVTCVSFGPVRQVMSAGRLAADALVVAVDYATTVAADVARDARLFLVDEAAQFRAARDDGQLEGYPDPDGLIGEAIRDGTTRPPHGRVLVTHLGVGLADLLFAGAVLARAAEEGRGLVLPR